MQVIVLVIVDSGTESITVNRLGKLTLDWSGPLVPDRWANQN